MFKGGRGGSPGAASHAWALANASQASYGASKFRSPRDHQA